MTRTTEILSTAEQRLYPNYGSRRVVLDHGRGAVLYDTEGRRYIDLYAGIAVSALGHGHPALVEAIGSQAARLIHQSNYFLSAPNVELGRKLCDLTGMARAFFCNSGTEANEAALKLVRRFFFDRGETERYAVVSFKNSFHGRTLGALAVTGQSKYSQGFGPTVGAVFVDYGDLAAVERELGPRVAAVIVEPVQGEGGVIPAPEGFLRDLRELCTKTGTLLIVDEIQTGVGRTGTFLACQAEGVVPDVVTLAKGLGSGVPIGAMLTSSALEGALPPGSHGTTFGGNPLASSAALATLDVLERDGLLARVATLGGLLTAKLEAIRARHPVATLVRGKGLLQALVLREGTDMQAVVTELRENGVLVTVAGGIALRFTPPLVITDAELDEGLGILDRTLEKFD